MKPEYYMSKGSRLIREMFTRGQYIFTYDETKALAKSQSIPFDQLSKVLSNLANRGWLLRLKRGLYAGTGSLLGEIHIPPFAIATRLVEPSAISHWSAMQHHGLTEQIPQRISAIATKKIVTPTMREDNKKQPHAKHMWLIEGIEYEYTLIKPENFFGIEEIWIDEHFKVPITDKERTLLDCFAAPRMFGGMGEALGIVENSLSTIDIEKIISYAIRYNKISVIKRIGWTLGYLGVSSKKLKKLLEIPSSTYHKLDPTKPSQGSLDKRWKIQNNLKNNLIGKLK